MNLELQCRATDNAITRLRAEREAIRTNPDPDPDPLPEIPSSPRAFAPAPEEMVALALSGTLSETQTRAILASVRFEATSQRDLRLTMNLNTLCDAIRAEPKIESP